MTGLSAELRNVLESVTIPPVRSLPISAEQKMLAAGWRNVCFSNNGQAVPTVTMLASEKKR